MFQSLQLIVPVNNTRQTLWEIPIMDQAPHTSNENSIFQPTT